MSLEKLVDNTEKLSKYTEYLRNSLKENCSDVILPSDDDTLTWLISVVVPRLTNRLEFTKKYNIPISKSDGSITNRDLYDSNFTQSDTTFVILSIKLKDAPIPMYLPLKVDSLYLTGWENYKHTTYHSLSDFKGLSITNKVELKVGDRVKDILCQSCMFKSELYTDLSKSNPTVDAILIKLK